MKKINKLLTSIIMIISFIPITTLALNKTETIYTILNSDGTVSKTTVTNKLTYTGKDTIEDETTLKEILNINGKETFKRNNNKLTWNTLNNDIIYQGKTDKKLPIDLKITYYLDEKEITPNNLNGKSGNIKIKYSFTNNEKKHININGSNDTIYTPFVTTLASIIKSDNNSNIEISNGKVVNTGNRSLLVGIASPGLYESMNINEFKKLNEITICYKTESFKLPTTYIISTPKLLENADLDIFNKMDSLSSNISLLKSNMNKLEKGTKDLENGIKAFSKGTEDLKKGISAIKENMYKIENGSISIDQGLEKILDTIKSKQNSLSENNISESLQKLNMLKYKNDLTINALINKTGISKDELFSMYKEYQLINYSGNDEKLISIKQTCELISLLEANNTAIDANINNITQTSKSINDLVTNLTTALTEIKNGSSTLVYGINEINTGISKLYGGSVKIDDGAKALSKGANELTNGTEKFNKEGINKLCNYATTIKKYKNKAQALVNLSDNYKGFTSNNSKNITFVSVIK